MGAFKGSTQHWGQFLFQKLLTHHIVKVIGASVPAVLPSLVMLYICEALPVFTLHTDKLKMKISYQKYQHNLCCNGCLPKPVSVTFEGQ